MSKFARNPSTEFFGKYGPGRNSDYEPHPLAAVMDFLESQAFQHRCDEASSRAPHNKEAARKRAEQFETHAATILAQAFPAHRAPGRFLELGKARRSAELRARDAARYPDREARAIEAENEFLALCEECAPREFTPDSRFAEYALKATAEERIAAAHAIILGRLYPGF